jgi:hypothetical protein
MPGAAGLARGLRGEDGGKHGRRVLVVKMILLRWRRAMWVATGIEKVLDLILLVESAAVLPAMVTR